MKLDFFGSCVEIFLIDILVLIDVWNDEGWVL